MNGLRTVLFEVAPVPRLRRLIVGVLGVVGTGLLVLGTWAAIVARTTASL